MDAWLFYSIALFSTWCFMDGWSIEFYEDADGKSQVNEWYESLDEKSRAKLLWIFDLLETNGIDVGMPYIKPLKDGLYEIRAEVKNKALRVIYFLYTGKRFILLHGFQKKTQETPANEIERAERYRQDFESRELDRT
jgi:phage-related protein